MAYRTRQEIFDLAWNGLKAQGFLRSTSQALRESLSPCAYRGDSGRRCAIGHCIPDDAYKPRLEGASASNKDVVEAANIDPSDAGFVRDLQWCHDNCDDEPTLMEGALRDFATNRRLSIPA
jgi:hypothetical protein